MVMATFRFYEKLNNFLPPQRRGKAFTCSCAEAATTKHMIEALGVPHTEVALILVNGDSVDFNRRLEDGDRVAVYPKFEAFDISTLLRLRPPPPPVMHFIADAHLAGLARLLRMAGFDTLYDNNYHDSTIETIAEREGRIVLTRDRELLKRSGITHGCYVHTLKSAEQWREIFNRLDLGPNMRPFTLCLHCNAPLKIIDKARVLHRIPPAVRELHTHFCICDVCQRVFWKGSHWKRMRLMLDETMSQVGKGHQ